MRLHQLSGNRAEQFAVDLNGMRNPERLIIEIANNPIPRLPDNGIDLSLVTEIEIAEVSLDHYN